MEVTPEESVLVVRKVEGAVQIRAFFLRRDDPAREAPGVKATFEEVVTALAGSRSAFTTPESSSATSPTGTFS